jgi:hypothetical protein
MSRVRGIEGREGEIWQQVQKELLAARKKAGKKVGAAIVKKQKSKLRASGAGGRRQKAVRHIVGKDGTLVLLDHAPLATAQEDGATIGAKGGFLPVGRAGQSLGKPGSKTPGAFVKKSKAGNLLLLRKTANGDLERLAVLLRSIRITKSLGFEQIAVSMADQYVDEIERNIIEGVNNGSR